MSVWLRQARRLKSLLRRRGSSREEAEDLVQEAFLRLHVFMTGGNEVQKPEAFLARTALNLAVDASRRDHRDRRSQFETETVEELQLLDLGPTPEEILTSEQRLSAMRRVLDVKVGAKTREIFFLHRLEGFTHDEIAERMQMSVRTVEKHIARAITLMWMERNRE
jgi:RNA polymerase sigma factor (sigma-70 family)